MDRISIDRLTSDLNGQNDEATSSTAACGCEFWVGLLFAAAGSGEGSAWLRGARELCGAVPVESTTRECQRRFLHQIKRTPSQQAGLPV